MHHSNCIPGRGVGTPEKSIFRLSVTPSLHLLEGMTRDSTLILPTLVGTEGKEMQTGIFVLAYFGPEVQLPLASIVGAISGVVLLVGAAPIRLARRWFTRIVSRRGAFRTRS